MARTFSLPTFFRMTPHALLETLFRRLQIDIAHLSSVWAKRKNVQPLLDFFYAQPLETQNQLESIFRDVFELACATGMEVLERMAEFFQQDGWNDVNHENKTTYAKSLSAWLHYPEVFAKALELHKIENSSWWRKRDGLPRITPQWNEETRQLLKSALEVFYSRKQGRGHVCTVEMCHYHGDMFYFMAYPDDYVRNILQHNEAGELVARKTRPTFEVVFAYNAVEGSLELHAQGGVTTKAALEEIFIQTVLDASADGHSPPPYDLSVIMRERFSLAPDPADGVQIFLKEISLLWPAKQLVKIMAKENRPSVEWVRTSVSEETLPLGEARIIHAKFQFVFIPQVSDHPGSVTFEIAAPDRCTLRNHHPKKVETIRKYLRQWGVEVVVGE